MKTLFVIGDSISCYYGEFLESMLAGRFAYDRKGGTHRLVALDDGTDGINGGDSSLVLAYLKKMGRIWQDQPPDYLLLNCGLHDLKSQESPKKYQVPVEDYRLNLQRILDCGEKLGTSTIWVRTTPVKDLPPDTVPDEMMTIRAAEDVLTYNAAADAVMRENGVPMVDLYTLTCNLKMPLYSDRGIHFNPETAARQAAFIAGALWPMGAGE